MSKAGKAAKTFKKVLSKVNHSNKVITNIPAGMATPGPPLGPMLGQVIPLSSISSWLLFCLIRAQYFFSLVL